MTRMELEIIFAAHPEFKEWFEDYYTHGNTATWKWYRHKYDGKDGIEFNALWKRAFPDIVPGTAYELFKREVKGETQ